jgi:hypothetical protein
MSFTTDMSRSNLLFIVQVTTYGFGSMDNPITNQFDRSLDDINDEGRDCLVFTAYLRSYKRLGRYVCDCAF